MALNKIRQKAWTYTLYESDGRYILSVVCGGAAMYELNVPLDDADGSKAAVDDEYLDTLAKEIAGNPHKFAQRSVKL